MARIAGEAPRPGRVTRSQSRELDDPVHDRSTRWNLAAGKGTGSVDRLSTVAENSPAKAHRKSNFASGTSIVPESPEGNISGTTFLPQEDSDPEDADLEPIIMIDELPGLQEASDRLLSLLKTNAPDARPVVDAAKKLANPRNTENKRLKPAIRKLLSQMKPFGSERFIDVAEAQGLIPTVQPKGAARPWSPSPALHRANCARLAIDILLQSTDSNSLSETIETLESQFPAPFLSQIVNGKESIPTGGSTAAGPTFDMALEIRTQFALVELEKQEKNKGFDARSVLENVFYGDGYTSDTGSLRGFNLPGTFADENGRLPDRFQDRVNDRFSELDYSLHDDDGNPNIKGLKAGFWSRFLVCTARFVQSRDKELRRDLEFQPKLEDVKDYVEKMIEGGESSEEDEVEKEQTSNRSTADRYSPNVEHQRSIQDDHSDNELFVPMSTPPPPPQQISQESIEHSTPTSPAKQPTPKSTHRRQSSKQNDLARNMDFLKRRREARQQQETGKAPEGDTTGFFSDMSVPEAGSQPQNLSDISFPSPGEVIRNPEGVTMPREIAQTPDEDLQYPHHDNDDTLLNDGEELDLGSYRRLELMQSTSPPGSERARQNYNRGRFFDSSPRNQFTSINEPQQRRTLLDQQEHRTRINFSSEDESQLTEKRMPQKSPAKQETAKRRHDEVENDSDNDDSDDAFDPPESKMVLVSNGASKLLEISNKRQRTNTTDEDSSAADQLHDDLIATRDTHQTQRQTSRQPASTQVQSPEPESSRVARARSEAVNPPSSQSRWSQANDPSSATITAANMRRRWTADENERLIQLIGRHGSAWAQIKAQDDICPRSEGGPKLQGRTQVNLKDRARNLKRACEREGTPLPRNFEFIKS